MDERVYWIWLQHAFGPGSPMPWRISQEFPGGVEAFYQGGPLLWNSRRDLRERDAAALYGFSLGEAEAQLEYALKAGWGVVTPAGRKYPVALKNIYDPPAVLYYQGVLPDVDYQPAIAVVGSRKAKKLSLDKAREVAYQLALGGAVVVTGGARGVDTAVAEGAMAARGVLLSVLPVALNSSYVSENFLLRRKIVERGGCLVTEYFSQQSPGYNTFQQRNRLITGFSCGVALIQAAPKSGTIMYASLARDQDRDVFVFPGPQGDPAFAGGWDLLGDGAKAFSCGEEILDEFALRFQRQRLLEPAAPLERPQPEPAAQPQPWAQTLAVADPKAAAPAPQARKSPTLTKPQEAVWEALGAEPLPVAVLEERTGLSAGRVLAALTELEILGLCQSCPGSRYRRA